MHSVPLPVVLCRTMSVGTPPPYFDTTVGLQPQLACGLIWELFEPSQLLGGGFRGQHVKVTNLSASPPLNWSRDGAIAIDAESLFHWSTVRVKKLNL